MTYLFIKPLFNIGRTTGRTRWRETRLYKLTKRTLIASLVCLLVSLANVMSIVITRGNLRGLVCLSCCTLDVTINVMTIHWVNVIFIYLVQIISIYSLKRSVYLNHAIL